MNDNTSAFCASKYEEEIRTVLPYYDDFYKQVVDIAKVQFSAPLTWLDVGCGTGKMAEAAFKALDIKKFVFCDRSEEMITIAKNRFSGDKSEFSLTAFPELDQDTSFDIITAVMVFHYFKKEARRKAIQTCYRNLRSNGIFITFENFAPNCEAGKRLFLERWRAYQRSQGRSQENCSEHIGRYGNKFFPISISEHLKLLRQCGFVQAEVFWVSNMQVGLLGIKQ